MSPPIIAIKNVSKTYATGFEALKDINLDIEKGEIFALLGPNGAGKTTLINIICGIVTPSAGKVTVDGHDIVTDYRAVRSLIGLVPQELTADMFESVWATVSFSRGLWGKWENPAYIESVLKGLSLWDRKDSKLMTLSGGMKRRVLIAKALSHEPLRDSGVTVILTTHYIHEAEDMADRIGVIDKGALILVEDKAELMHKLGKKQLTLQLHQALDAIPAELEGHHLALANGGSELVYTYDTQGPRTGITGLITDLSRAGIRFKDLDTTQSSLEDIFVDLVRRDR